MDKFFGGILNVIAEFQKYTFVFAAIAIISVCIALLLGGDDEKAKIKMNFFKIAFAVSCMGGAVNLAKWFTSNLSF